MTMTIHHMPERSPANLVLTKADGKEGRPRRLRPSDMRGETIDGKWATFVTGRTRPHCHLISIPAKTYVLAGELVG